jgi:deferrochelatase/peroxidase EfeB
MTIAFADVQANILRGVTLPLARHFLLAGRSASETAQFIGALLDGSGPRISNAAPWAERPEYVLTLGLTAPGLAALGLPPALLAAFPDAFASGAAARAGALGDVGAAAPAGWAYGGAGAEHLVLSLYTKEASLAALSTALRGRMAQFGMAELGAFDAASFPHGEVHFGYRDGIAQPRIEGVPRKASDALPDMQPASSAGEFLLGGGHVNQFAGNWLGDLPPELGDNASYGVLRMIRQEVATFEALLVRVAQRYAVDPEWVAAKLMGRWRNGVPLTLTAGGERPQPMPPALPTTALNRFDYAPTPEHPAFLDDREGLRCPIGSHIRRLNPRSALVMGKPHTRRIIRRAMPYGPRWQAGQGDDGVERGLLGYFVCGDVESQFEFLLQTWANRDYATHGLRGTTEPILGLQAPQGGRFVIRTDNALDPIVIDDLPQLTVTRGCLYCFLPGIGGLRRLAALA